MLSIDGVSKSFGGVHALRGVSFDCGDGEILGLIGPNGAGKSTLVNASAACLRPDAGTIRLGETILPAAARNSRPGLASAGHSRICACFAAMTARQNVEVAHISCARHRPEAGARRSTSTHCSRNTA